MADTVIFDCDGVLVDSEVLVTEIESAMFADIGISLTPTEVADRYVGLATSTMTTLIAEEFGVHVGPDFFDEAAARVAAVFDARLQPVNGISGVLDHLDQLAVPRCVASSSPPERIAHSLGLTGLERFFEPDRVFSATMVERGKPEPDLFLHAARSLGSAPDRCVVIEDSAPGVRAGIAAGMRVVGLTAAGHCGPAHGERLWAAGAHAVVGSAPELLAALGFTRQDR